MKTLTLNEIEKIQESKMISSVTEKVICILLNAINDWPNPIFKLEDYELEVHNFINGETTSDNIKSALAEIDFSKKSWQAESLSQIVDVFQFYNEGKSLKEILSDLIMEVGSAQN